MQDRIEQNALELLNAIREHHPDIYAGAWVNPYTAAQEAGLDPDSSHYRVAMEYLQAEDVLEEAEESRELGEGGPLYTITLRGMQRLDRKSTRLNSSHGYISYAVFCLKKKIKKK